MRETITQNSLKKAAIAARFLTKPKPAVHYTLDISSCTRQMECIYLQKQQKEPVRPTAYRGPYEYIP